MRKQYLFFIALLCSTIIVSSCGSVTTQQDDTGDACAAAISAAPKFDLAKIVGGEPAVISDWPWIAALVEHGTSSPASSQFCGGTLIASRWVLTAAHCIDGSAIDVVLGTSDLTAAASQYERIAVTASYQHSSYNSSTGANDIGLLHLASATTKTPASLDTTSLASDGTTGSVAGWGATNAQGTTSSDTLRQVDLPVVSEATCLACVGGGSLPNYTFCAGYAAGGKDSCYGDSGGPFEIDGKIAGIVSTGPELCAQANGYGVYTRVSSYGSWISSTMAAHP